MNFDFDIKYGFSTSPFALDFEKQEQKTHYTLKSEADVKASR